MDGLTLYGLISVTMMLVFYALEGKSVAFVFLFAVSCLMASVYGFLQGAWPFGIVEAVWSMVALRRWYERRKLEKRESAGA
ncbi:MAG TPA: hypothetical protein PKD05_08780 [Candidatus Melainabacteria bacterium]|nr:hypothetical protein [Candidatus Melainabacteria bacterium]